MSQNEILIKIEELQSYEQLIEEATKCADELRDAIKAEMLAQDTEEMQVGQYIVRWTAVLSQRFDSTAFKAAGFADLYKQFLKQVSSRRFTIS